jgi:hypothetical protein
MGKYKLNHKHKNIENISTVFFVYLSYLTKAPICLVHFFTVFSYALLFREAYLFCFKMSACTPSVFLKSQQIQ